MGAVKFSPSWSDRISRLRFDDPRAMGAFGLLALLGGGGWLLRASRPPAQTDLGSREPLHHYNVRIEGRVTGLRPDRVTVYLPQLPYQLTRRWTELEHPSADRFVLPLEVKAQAPATMCHLRLQAGSKMLEAGRAKLESNATSLTFPAYQAHMR